ncbi:MAG: hydroxyisourate hydrolase [Planctomycetota bacterium]
MKAITTHVLDTTRGRGAHGVEVVLALRLGAGPEWHTLAQEVTDENGRVGGFKTEPAFAAGVYRLRFGLGAYFDRQGSTTFYPYADVVFHVADPRQHYHVPLLASPHGYTTYRGT